MRWIISLILVAIIIFLAYSLIINIQEPITFQAEKVKRKDIVTGKLEKIRSCQEIFKEIKGGFAPNFDSLAMVLTYDSIPTVKIEGDPDDPTTEFIKTVTYSMAIDSIKALGFNLDSLKYVPFGDGKVFSMDADTITYQSVNVPVVEVATRYEDFMGETFSSPRFKKFDNSYNPKASLKIGDMTKPTLAGNW